MNTKNISITAVAALLVLGMAAMAFAGPGYGRGYGHMGNGYGHMGYGYGNGYAQLTPEKQKAVNDIFAKYDGKFEELRTQMWAKRSVLQALVNGGSADEKKITALVSDIQKLRDQMIDTREAMGDELQQETGLEGFGAGFGACPGFGGGRGNARMGGWGHMGPGYGHMGQGYGYMGNGYGMGNGPGYGMNN